MIFVFIFILFIDTISSQNVDQNSVFNYSPLINRKEDLALLRNFWPMYENAFISDLHQLDACTWAILQCEAKPDKALIPNPTNPDNPDENSTLAAAGGIGILDNIDVLKEIQDLRDYIENELKLPLKDTSEPLRYANVCMSYISPITNRSVCRFPETDLVKMLNPTERQKAWKSWKSPSIYPLLGDKGSPLGLKMMTGPYLGGVELDRVSGQVRQAKSIVFKYFFKTHPWSNEWRNTLRDYILNKYASTVIDIRYIDDEMMKLRLVDKNSNANVVARMLDPTPTATTSGFWPDGLTAQLIFNQIPDLSRDIELNRALKTVNAFENTQYTFGEEGTVCWIRAFVEWRKWLIQNLYSGLSMGDEADIQSDTVRSISPFGSFQEDLKIFLKNPNYPVYSQHVITDVIDGKLNVKAFRCLITLKNLSDQNQRTQAVQFLRDLASKAQHNVTVVAMDFFPPVQMSAWKPIQSYALPFGLAVITLIGTLKL